MKKPVVISVGGSILVPQGEDIQRIQSLASSLLSLASDRQLFVVVGGGRYSRAYINMGRALGGSEEVLDSMGIQVTRLNALLLKLALRSSGPVPETVEEAAEMDGRIVIMGGTVPGHTTDAVSAMLAVETGADVVVNATDVDGVYTADPKKNPEAERIPRISFSELEAMVRDAEGRAGAHVPFDPKGVRLLMEHGKKLVIVAGRDAEALKMAVEGDYSIGTLVE